MSIGRDWFVADVRLLAPDEAIAALRYYERRHPLLRPIVHPMLSRLAGWHSDGSPQARRADLPDAVHAAADSGQPLTLALVELAGVDTAVHLLGRRRAELLVCAAAATLAAPQRPGPAVAPATYRLAGEVFAVVLPGVGTDAAFDVVDELLGHVARTAAPLSAGAGLATLDARCPDAQLLLVGASAALDEARSLGGGRVVASAEEGTGLRWLATPGHPEAY